MLSGLRILSLAEVCGTSLSPHICTLYFQGALAFDSNIIAEVEKFNYSTERYG